MLGNISEADRWACRRKGAEPKGKEEVRNATKL